MQATINATLVKTLTAQPLAADIDVRDPKLVGFTLRCRRSGVHTYRVQIGRGKWYTLGTTGKLKAQQARDEAERVLALAALGKDPVEERRAKRRAVTLGAFIREVYTPWARTHLRTGGETVTRLLAQFADFDKTLLPDLHAFQLERWRTSRRNAGAKPVTINRDLSDLKAMLTRAVQWKYLKAHPLTDVKPDRLDRRAVVRYLSVPEAKALQARLDGRDVELHEARASANAWRAARGYELLPALPHFPDHLHPIVLLALHTGLRRGELFNLRWTDVDLTAKRLTVQGTTAKTGQTRHVPLNAEAVRVLTLWSPMPSGLVFPADDTRETPLTDVKTAWLKLLKDAGIKGFRFHDLRHTFASRLVQAGVDLNIVRELLGHTSMTMTLRYAHLRPQQAADAVELLVTAGGRHA